MHLTEHATKRMQQRGVSEKAFAMMLEYGRCERAKRGAIEIFFGKKEYQKAIEEVKGMIQLLDNAKGHSVIMDARERVVTVYKTNDSGLRKRRGK